MHCERCNKSIGSGKEGSAYPSGSDPSISRETLDFLNKTYYSTLCSKCITEIDTLVRQGNSMKSKGQGTALVENIHYYREGDMFVFTELYHILKGNCCHNNCRHCAYGFSIRGNAEA